jgi:hypothetical protein
MARKVWDEERHPRDPGGEGGGQWVDVPGTGDTLEKLKGLAPKMAEAAQPIYDEWEQDEEGVDEEFGGGGICDAVSEAIGGVVADNLDVELMEGGQGGDDHAYLMVRDSDGEGYIVDIPHTVYERGGGYKWEKVEGVKFGPEDVMIEHIGPVESQEEEF